MSVPVPSPLFSSLSERRVLLFSVGPQSVYPHSPRFLSPSKHSVSPLVYTLLTDQMEDFPAVHLAAGLAVAAAVREAARLAEDAAALLDVAVVAVVAAAGPAEPVGAPESSSSHTDTQECLSRAPRRTCS